MYRVAFDFVVTRRVHWADDFVSFHGHIDRVRKRIEARTRIDDVRVIADISESRLALDFLIEAADEDMAATDALHVVSSAIRECGARHLGSHPIPDGSEFVSQVNTFSGLRTPVWQRRRILVAAAA